jgi:hypothetical protein
MVEVIWNSIAIRPMNRQGDIGFSTCSRHCHPIFHSNRKGSSSESVCLTAHQTRSCPNWSGFLPPFEYLDMRLSRIRAVPFSRVGDCDQSFLTVNLTAPVRGTATSVTAQSNHSIRSPNGSCSCRLPASESSKSQA